MNFNRGFFPYAALVVAAMLSLSGCGKTKPQQSNSPSTQPAQTPQNAQQASSGQPAPGQSAPGQPGTTAAQAPLPPPPPPPPAPTVVELPRGTRLPVRLDQAVGSKISQPGEPFGATIAEDVIVGGQVIIPHGARAEGTVIDAKPLGRFKGGALLEMRLERVHTRWGSYPVTTSTMERAEKGKGKRTAGFIGGGGGVGALIGGLAGGGKGALIGGLAGAGAGTAGSAFTGNKQIVLPAETLLTFRLEHPVHITQQK